MTRRPVDSEDPARLYTVTGGRSRVEDDAFDLVTLIVSDSDPIPGMPSEHMKILRMCRHPMAVAEISADLRLPVSVVKILLGDLLDMGQISARHPSLAPVVAQLPDPRILKQVLLGLQKL